MDGSLKIPTWYLWRKNILVYSMKDIRMYIYMLPIVGWTDWAEILCGVWTLMGGGGGVEG